MVVYRHPALQEAVTGSPGRWVRWPLAVVAREHAKVLVQHLQRLPDDSSYWRTGARPHAEQYLDRRAADAFYGPMQRTLRDSRAERETVLPLPPRELASRVMLLSTTGAGKTTLVRQLLGTHPRTERFPSTSTAKTTVADTEVIFADGPFQAVVTFVAQEEIAAALLDNAVAAVLAVAEGDGTAVALAKLLEHVSQRFRLGYVLGRQPAGEDEQGDERWASGRMDEDTHSQLLALLETLGAAAARISKDLQVNPEFADDETEDALDTALRSDDELLGQVDVLLDLAEERFGLLQHGELRRDASGWPIVWSFSCADRAEFLSVLTRFSSNHAGSHGRLLTSLVVSSVKQ